MFERIQYNTVVIKLSNPGDYFRNGLQNWLINYSIFYIYNGLTTTSICLCIHDGAKTLTEYKVRMHQIENTLNRTRPKDLLEEDRYLVLDHNPKELALAATKKEILLGEGNWPPRSPLEFLNVRGVTWMKKRALIVHGSAATPFSSLPGRKIK